MADDKLVRLTSPSGSTVRVSAERAELLMREGYAEVKSTTAKKSSSSKSSDK